MDSTEELQAGLREAHRRLAKAMRERFDRDLPLAELLVDRWERARDLGFGEGTSIHASSHVYGRVEVGKACWIGPFTILDGSGGLRIGDHCDISAGVQIYSHDTTKRAVSAGRDPIERSPVAIGDRCHIGAGAIVLPGVTVGDGVVIGAGAVVTKNIPSGSVVVGVPARQIRSTRSDRRDP